MKKFLSQYKHAWVFLYFIFYLPWYFGLQLRGDSGKCTSFYNIWSMVITGWIYCKNVFPSIHVYNSIGCAIALIKCYDFRNSITMKIFASTSAILITLSTMFIKQHSVLDAVSAGILAIILYILIYKVDIFKINQRVDAE